GVGVVGSLLAAAGILERFTDFLLILGVVTPPIAGIMVAEYFVVRRWRPVLDASREQGTLPETEPTWVPATLVIWVVSALTGWLSEHYQWPGIPALTSLILAGVLYIAAGKLGLVRGTREQQLVPAP
ncbi:cytosine permease, partial [Nonomuraea sp. NPDC055795]